LKQDEWEQGKKLIVSFTYVQVVQYKSPFWACHMGVDIPLGHANKINVSNEKQELESEI